MNLSAQIKKYRKELSLSQEELAEKVFVSRQSVSNWENDKTYPDLKSLLLLSEIFSVSLDQLVKGDVEIMKNKISEHDQKEFERYSRIFTIFMLGILILPVPLFKWMGLLGGLIYALFCVFGMFYAWKVERYKKQLNIQTYKEITAFMEGKELSEKERICESGKRMYQKILLAFASGVIALVVMCVMLLIL